MIQWKLWLHTCVCLWPELGCLANEEHNECITLSFFEFLVRLFSLLFFARAVEKAKQVNKVARMVTKDGNCLNCCYWSLNHQRWIARIERNFCNSFKFCDSRFEQAANSMFFLINFKSILSLSCVTTRQWLEMTRNLVDPARHTRWSQRLSHACLRPSSWNSETAKGSVYQNLVIRVTCVHLNIEMDNRRNSRANTYFYIRCSNMQRLLLDFLIIPISFIFGRLFGDS